MLSRDEILGADDLHREEVQVPEWKGAVWVRVMAGVERDWLDAASLNDQGEVKSVQDRLANYRGRLVALCACDEQGTSLFTLPDAEGLGRKAAKALDRIVDVAQRLNAMTTADVEQLTGELKNAPDSASGSTSP